MNIREIVSSTRAYNLHSHTQFCDGRADMARFVEAAVEAGMTHLGFTPHSPIPIASPCNMSAGDVDEYITVLSNLRKEYEGRINLYLSMEIDYLGKMWGATSDYFNTVPLDYRLSSIHFIPTQDGELIDIDGSPQRFVEKMHSKFHDDIRYVVDTFYAHTIDMIEAEGFDMIGHFDKIGFNASFYQPGIEDEDWYKKHIDNVIDLLLAKELVIEINTKAWEAPVGISSEDAKKYVPRMFPSPHIVRRLRDSGAVLAVNSDVHYPERITFGRRAAFDIIDSL